MKDSLKNYLVEFIGTFFLVFTVSSTILYGAEGVIPAIAIGFALMIMVYAGGHISGGHYNPAVSLAAAMRGALPYSQLLPYWGSQILGGVLAALLAISFASEPLTLPETCKFGPLAMITGEFLFTFALCYVVLMTATCKKVEKNSFYGLAIGSTVTVGAFAVGGILCFGAFNPSVAISLGVLHAACWPCVVVTIVANLVAAVIAALAFKFITED